MARKPLGCAFASAMALLLFAAIHLGHLDPVDGYEVVSQPMLSPWKQWLWSLFSKQGRARNRKYRGEKVQCPEFPNIDLPNKDRLNKEIADLYSLWPRYQDRYHARKRTKLPGIKRLSKRSLGPVVEYQPYKDEYLDDYEPGDPDGPLVDEDAVESSAEGGQAKEVEEDSETDTDQVFDLTGKSLSILIILPNEDVCYGGEKLKLGLPSIQNRHLRQAYLRILDKFIDDVNQSGGLKIPIQKAKSLKPFFHQSKGSSKAFDSPREESHRLLQQMRTL